MPADEQLTLVPFQVGDTAGLRLVRVVPGVAVQFTDGPKDRLEATEQPQLVIAAAPGGPPTARDRDQFARDAMSGLPPLKDVRIVSSEPMRIGGQPGHEVRAQAKDAQTGADIEIVQWLRFGTGAYLRILGLRAEGQVGRDVHALPRRARRPGAAVAATAITVGRDCRWRRAAAAGAALAPPFATATSAGRSTRSPIR